MNAFLELAYAIVHGTLREPRNRALKPISVVVLDPGGHLVAFQREDGASHMRPQIAIDKAALALALGVSSRRIGEMAIERAGLVNALAPLAPGGLVPAAGGVIVCDSDDR